MKKITAIYRKKEPTRFANSTWYYDICEFEVEVMTITKGYAMVRRKGCTPFVVREKDLEITLN